MPNQESDFNLDELMAQLNAIIKSEDGETPQPPSGTTTSAAEPVAILSEASAGFSTFGKSEPSFDAPVPAQGVLGQENDIAFDVKFRGYAREQVEHYLAAVTEEFNAMCTRCTQLEAENEALRKMLIALSGLKGKRGART